MQVNNHGIIRHIDMEVMNIYLYHYFDKTMEPFANLSDIPIDEAKAILSKIKIAKPNVQSAERRQDYMERRHIIEEILSIEFAKKGGIIKRKVPHYMVIGHSPWLSTWFENSAAIKIPITEFDLKTISFTYGDAFPVFSEGKHKMDDKEYRRKLYVYHEIVELIEKYGLPQEWNNDGQHGPERYIEAHIWCDEVIDRYRKQNRRFQKC